MRLSFAADDRSFDLRPSTGELRRDGAPMPLQEKPRRVLEALLERPGELVTRDELRAHLWGEDVFVDFDANLNTAVRTLRRALGDDASAPRFVETVPGRGYRFVARVSEAVDRGAGEVPGTVRDGAEEVPGTVRDGTVRDVPGTSYEVPGTWARLLAGLLAVAVATGLALSLSGGREAPRDVVPPPATAAPRTVDVPPAAAALVLEADAQWRRFDRQGYDRAIELYQRALELAPGSAAAWSGLAETWNLLAWSPPGPRSGPHAAFPRALEAADRAIALDPSRAEAHAARGFALLYYAWDFDDAEGSFERALELSPSSPMTHHWAAGLYSALGRHDEAIAAMLRAEALDPVSLSIRSDLGWYHLFARRPDAALEACERTLADAPDYGWAIACLREAHRQRGDLDAAADAARRWLALGAPVEGEPRLPDDADGPTVLRAALEIELHRGLQRRTERPAPFGLAALYASLGRADDAFRWLERAVEARDGWLIFLAVHPDFEPIAEDPRFVEVVERVGLPVRSR